MASDNAERQYLIAREMDLLVAEGKALRITSLISTTRTTTTPR